jgi:alpha-glucosidase (family GH31 glycosyl hydrolase)
MADFAGTNSNYSFWIDMNEPSVFNNPTMTLPLNDLHYTKYGKAVLHRDVHNMYGTL